MYVFIAGEKYKGFLKSHARTTLVNKLSHKPFEILANVFASRGAIRSMSAHFLETNTKLLVMSEIQLSVDVFGKTQLSAIENGKATITVSHWLTVF